MAHIYEQNIFIIVCSWESFPFSFKVDLRLCVCKHIFTDQQDILYELWTSTLFFSGVVDCLYIEETLFSSE